MNRSSGAAENPLLDLLQHALFASGPTRGAPTEAIGDIGVEVIRWRTVP